MNRASLSIALAALAALAACKRGGTCGQVLIAMPIPTDWEKWPVVAESSSPVFTTGRGGYMEETDTTTLTVGAYTLSQTTSRGSPVNGDYLDISNTTCTGDHLRSYLIGSTSAQPGYRLGEGKAVLRQRGDDFVLVGEGAPVRSAFAAFTRRWNPSSRWF